MALSLISIAGTRSSNRLLMFAGLGRMGLRAQFLGGSWQGAEWLPRSRLGRRCVGVLARAVAATHVLMGPLGLLLGSSTTWMLGDSEKAAAASA